MKNKNNKGIWIAALVLAALLAVAGLLYKSLSAGMGGENLRPTQGEGTSGSGSQAEEPRPAPDFTVEDWDGNKVSLADFRGKPVVLNFWATWCGYCKMEMPGFEELYQEMGEDVHFVMLNVTGGRETEEIAKSFIEKEGYQFPVYFDKDMSASMTYGASGLPITFFIDSEGRAIAVGQGALDKESVRRGIQMALDATK